MKYREIKMIWTGECHWTEEGGGSPDEYRSRRRGPCNGMRIHPVYIGEEQRAAAIMSGFVFPRGARIM